jgi:hypothetical protein
MIKKNNGAVELIILNLKIGFGLQDFIDVNHDIDPWLRKQQGFRSRIIFEESNGRIYDLLTWDTESHGRKAMGLLMKNFADSPIHNMIDQRSVNWFVSPIAHALIK